MIKQICLPFPIRPDFLAQIVAPIDMTQGEANRLCVFIMCLAKPELITPVPVTP